jgi:hypothetical protein
VGRILQIQIFKLDLEGEIYFFNINLLMNFFIIHVVFGRFWLTVCLFVVCKNYLDIVRLIIHIAFHLHNCIVYFFSTLHLFYFFFHFFVNVWVDFWIDSRILFWQKKILIYNFSFRVGNILIKNGGIKSKWKFNFDWKKWGTKNEENFALKPRPWNLTFLVQFFIFKH